MGLNSHGQPVIRTFNAARSNDHMIDELIGLCRGVLSMERSPSSTRAHYFRWMNSNRDIAQHWPAQRPVQANFQNNGWRVPSS